MREYKGTRIPCRLLVCAALALMLLMMAGSACAEIAQIVTGGGPVKMRTKASSKSRIVTTIPNKTYVEVDEAGEDWCHVIYKNKSGYVMSEYVVLASAKAQEEPAIAFSPAAPTVGCVMDFTVTCEGAVAYEYVITPVNGKPTRSEKTTHSTASYRPRKAGITGVEVTAWLADGTSKTNATFFEIVAAIPDAQYEQTVDGITLYSQKDGWWLDKKYRTSDLDTSGCAIFTLSHALQLMGHTTENDRPEQLAVSYAFCLVDGGTLNSTLIGRAAKNYGFATRAELFSSEKEIAGRLQDGALFTFAIVKGHIALISGLSEDGTKVRIIDSAPSATFERLENAQMYLPGEDGDWQVIEDLGNVPGARYYFETNQYGGMTYYLDLSYVAKRGVRLIQAKD